MEKGRDLDGEVRCVDEDQKREGDARKAGKIIGVV